MVSVILSRIVVLIFGTLYPAYKSYKAVKTRNSKEYVKWMMYWIVFALFISVETFTDIFISWIPFYYEIKILFVIWLLSPATKGASILYRKFIHPQLMKRENEIDAYIAKASDQGYTAILSLGSKGFNVATNFMLTTAMKGQSKITDHLKKSYSLNDLTDEQDGANPYGRQDSMDMDEDDVAPYDCADNRNIEESYAEEMHEAQVPHRRKPTKSESLHEIEETEEEHRSAGTPSSSRKSHAHGHHHKAHSTKDR